ncbi:MAG: oxidoreductase [Micrococcales bacterium]|nr:MAG: oxidoreductase [Micrococcales bacterium]PIE26368.1 MAG: oxidoreductase [Micrococcales bacterium]
MDLGLADRVYIVTGASKGLGRACAQLLIDEGARLVIAARDHDALTETARQLGRPENVIAVAADIQDPETPAQLVAAAAGRFNRLDGSIISVGGPPAGSAMDITDAQWLSSFDTVFLGAVRTARAVVRGMSSEGGSLLFVLSSSVKSPIPGLAVSNGLRPGLAMVAKTLADELGPRAIRVNAVLPGRIDTDRVRELDEATGDPHAAEQAFLTQIPLGRYGEASEFARPAVVMLSPAASYVTGTVLPIDGGMLRTL